ncbi:MAG: hypothetical protein Q9187_001125 [Circinaria calcarea]
MTHTELPLLLSFPTELAQAILFHAPDFISLRALTLSSPFFYRAFLTAQKLILNKVLSNEFRASRTILPDALTTFTSARLSLQSDSQIRDDQIKSFLLNLHPITALPEIWSLSDFWALSTTHDHVKYFANDFAITLSANPLTGASHEVPSALTPTEMDRVERALYRYELYCNLFGKNHGYGRLDWPDQRRPDFRDQQRMFFGKFAPWENEQLATIYEYLVRKLSTAFNDVAEHDVVWGEFTVPFQDDYDPLYNYRDHWLSLGLEYLHRLATASTYNERYELLNPEFKCDSDFLYPAYSEPADDDYDEILIADLTEQDRDRILKPPFVKDPDVGPAEAWRWAYQGETTAYIYFQPDQRQLRKNGYVMFDYDRLCRWNLFSESYKPADRYNSEDAALTALRTDQMRKSWDERSKIWLRGGRGWWSENDQSKLVWDERLAVVARENTRANTANGTTGERINMHWESGGQMPPEPSSIPTQSTEAHAPSFWKNPANTKVHHQFNSTPPIVASKPDKSSQNQTQPATPASPVLPRETNPTTGCGIFFRRGHRDCGGSKNG